MPEDEPNNKPETEKVSLPALWTIIIVLVVMALVALHLNWVRWQRDKIEKVIVTPIESSPSPTP